MTADDPVLPRLLQAQARARPDATFLMDLDGASWTYAETGELVARWAAVLHGLGVRQGDYVGSMLPTGATAAQVWLAIGTVGAVEVPIHTEYRGRLLAHVLNHASCRVLVTCSAFLERLREIDGALEHLQQVVVVDELADWWDGTAAALDGAELLAEAAPHPAPCELHPSDLATVLFTSGTTGVSKGVMMPYAHLRATTEGCWPAEAMSAQDTYYCPLPGFHISGKIAVDSMLRAGGRVAFRERFRTPTFWADVRAADATCACIMGAMEGFLMAQPEQPGDADNPMDRVLMLPLPPDVAAFSQRFGVRVRSIFNQTEISCPIVTDGFGVTEPDSCGRVRDGYQCRIVDEHDEPVPTGTVGELVVRAEQPWVLMAGYLGMPGKTVETIRNQWLHTGDAFRVDEDGNYYFVDRIKDVIRRRGENISSFEVESAVGEHPDVVECAAVAVASEWTEDEVKVVVVRRPGSALTAPELIDFVRPRMARFMVPRYVEFRDALPKTETQKVRKTELRELDPGTWDREAQAVT